MCIWGPCGPVIQNISAAAIAHVKSDSGCNPLGSHVQTPFNSVLLNGLVWETFHPFYYVFLSVPLNCVKHEWNKDLTHSYLPEGFVWRGLGPASASRGLSEIDLGLLWWAVLKQQPGNLKTLKASWWSLCGYSQNSESLILLLGTEIVCIFEKGSIFHFLWTGV